MRGKESVTGFRIWEDTRRKLGKLQALTLLKTGKRYDMVELLDQAVNEKLERVKSKETGQ